LLVCDHKIGDEQEEECTQQPTRKLGVAGASAEKMAVFEAELNWWHCWKVALYHCWVSSVVSTPSLMQLIHEGKNTFMPMAISYSVCTESQLVAQQQLQ